MLTLGTVTVYSALVFLLLSAALYLFAPKSSKEAGFVGAGRACYWLSALSIIGASAILGTLLVTHRFDCQYVYQHSARAMAPLYWFPSFWSGQEGSFLLWAFWAGIVGAILTMSSGNFERRVMPVYSGILLFLVSLLIIKSPFVPLDTQGAPIPTEGLGLNPNLENPWMVIHPPTLFLGFASLGVPFAYALAGLFWQKSTGWLKQTLPWSLFGFSFLGLAMMMGGYWAYEMLGWGGFWGWDPVENGPLIPWLFLVSFLHIAQIDRAKGRASRGAALFALMPFLSALYETFLTRTGILSAFSVHSFSTLGGVANEVILYGMLGAMALSVVLLLRYKGLKQEPTSSDKEELRSREFGYFVAVILLTICAAISAVGMSAPLLTGFAQTLHWTDHVAAAPEDFYNRATFPIALLLTIGMGLGPHLAWRGKGEPNTQSLVRSYAIAVGAAFFFVVAVRIIGTMIKPGLLVGELALFTTSVFAIASNIPLLYQRLFKSTVPATARAYTLGGTVSHIGAAFILVGVTCLVCFTHKSENILLPMGSVQPVLNKAYNVTYVGQTGNYKTDRDNALKFDVVATHGSEHFTALLPFALRALDNGQKKLFGHPAIIHHAGEDLYFALRDGPDQQFNSPLFETQIPLGQTRTVSGYTLTFVEFDRDPAAAAYVQATGKMPPVFPVTAVVKVVHDGETSYARPQYITHSDDPDIPDTPEVKLPNGWLIAIEQMNAGSSDPNNPNAGATTESGTFGIRQDTGPPVEAFTIDVTTRPMISLVWLGTLILVIGGLLGMLRRAREARIDPIILDESALADADTHKPTLRRRERREAATAGKKR